MAMSNYIDCYKGNDTDYQKQERYKYIKTKGKHLIVKKDEEIFISLEKN